VLSILREKRGGFYVEVGAGLPHKFSNTYLLEKRYSWRGLGVDIDPVVVKLHQDSRRNPCLLLDAMKVDWKPILEKYHAPQRIDFLQIDIEPAINTLTALRQIPFNHYRFTVITFEHDLYLAPSNARIKLDAKSLLEGHGYLLVKDNVKDYLGREFEDWYVDSEYVFNLNIAKINQDLWYRVIRIKFKLQDLMSKW